MMRTMAMRMTIGRRRLAGAVVLGAVVASAICWGLPPVAVTLEAAQYAQQSPAAPSPSLIARLEAQQPQQRPPAAVDGFVPMDEVPDHDKLPAAPYLIGAYAVAWVAVLFYVWSLWSRLSRVEDELRRLSSSASKP